MTKTKSIYLALLAVLLSPMAANADPVTVGNLEWRQLTDTINTNADDLASICDGATGSCSGSVGSVSFDGWTWASYEEVITLLVSLTPLDPTASPVVYNDSSKSSIWADQFSALFDSPNVNTSGRFYAGLSRTFITQGGFNFYRKLTVLDITGSNVLNDRVSADAFSDPSARPTTGYWLYRAVSVPEPGTLALLGLGLAGMAARRRKKA